MKKPLSALLIFTSLSLAAAPQKAEAGFCILAATQEFVWKHKYETLDTILVIALPISLIATGLFAVGFPGLPINNFSLIAGAILLGDDVNANKSEISSALVNRYPYLSDDTAAVNRLTDKIIAKYPSAKDSDGNAIVSLSVAEIAEATTSLDLSPADRADLTTTLSK